MTKSKAVGKKYGKRTRAVSHPNQWTGTPQQEKFLLLWLDPNSATFANPYESAMEAGYSEDYARIIATPSINNQWIKESRMLMKMGPEHVIQALQTEAVDRGNKASDRIKALELVGKIQGIFVERHVVGHTNIEQALNELK